MNWVKSFLIFSFSLPPAIAMGGESLDSVIKASQRAKKGCEAFHRDLEALEKAFDPPGSVAFREVPKDRAAMDKLAGLAARYPGDDPALSEYNQALIDELRTPAPAHRSRAFEYRCALGSFHKAYSALIEGEKIHPYPAVRKAKIARAFFGQAVSELGKSPNFGSLLFLNDVAQQLIAQGWVSTDDKLNASMQEISGTLTSLRAEFKKRPTPQVETFQASDREQYISDLRVNSELAEKMRLLFRKL